MLFGGKRADMLVARIERVGRCCCGVTREERADRKGARTLGSVTNDTQFISTNFFQILYNKMHLAVAKIAGPFHCKLLCCGFFLYVANYAILIQIKNVY